MAFERERVVGNNVYLYLEIRYREGGKVRSKSIYQRKRRSDQTWDDAQREQLARQDAKTAGAVEYALRQLEKKERAENNGKTLAEIDQEHKAAMEKADAIDAANGAKADAEVKFVEESDAKAGLLDQFFGAAAPLLLDAPKESPADESGAKSGEEQSSSLEGNDTVDVPTAGEPSLVDTDVATDATVSETNGDSDEPTHDTSGGVTDAESFSGGGIKSNG